MKRFLSLLSLLLSLTFAAQAKTDVWPDSCGNQQTDFKVTTEKGQPSPAEPASGKAELILIQGENEYVATFQKATVRFGMDGSWVGADNGNSYFAVMVDPGVHHLCANWQSSLKRLNKNVDLTSFTAEAGHVYYYAAQVTSTSQNSQSFAPSQLNDDEGKYQVKTRN